MKVKLTGQEALYEILSLAIKFTVLIGVPEGGILKAAYLMIGLVFDSESL